MLSTIFYCKQCYSEKTCTCVILYTCKWSTADFLSIPFVSGWPVTLLASHRGYLWYRKSLGFFFFKILFIYSWETQREREREVETQAEGEAGYMQRTRHGTRSRVSRIRPWPEGVAKPLSHPGCPSLGFLNWAPMMCFTLDRIVISPHRLGSSYWIPSLLYFKCLV